MRRAWGYRLTTIAIGLSAGAAPMLHAEDVAFPVVPAETAAAASDGAASAPLRRAAVKARRFAVIAMPRSLAAIDPAIDSSTDSGTRPVTRDFDLRLARSYQSNLLTPIKRAMRARGTGMKDAYLHGSSGLRASVGSSYHMKYRASDYGPAAAAGTAALMRMPAGTVNLRDGYESYAPVAMVGYDAPINDRLKVGVEGGMMVGRSAAMYTDETVPGLNGQNHGARNPVADVVMSLVF